MPAPTTREEYNALPGLSYSGMKELLFRSPAHYQHWLANPRPDSKAFRIGRATHCAFLTPDLWATTYKAIPECDRRTKEGKAVHEAFMSSLKAGDEALAFDEYELVTEIAQAASRIADNLIYRTGAWVEKPLLGKDKTTALKGIPDLIDAEGWVYDLKTTDDASERAFTRTILNYGYHIQAAHYLTLAGCNRSDIRGFRIVAVEKDAPHEGCVYEIAGDLLEQGRKECERAYSLYDRCMASGNWPGLAPLNADGDRAIIKLTDLPWAKKAADGSAIAITF
jgi:exodeoxyribonuclease VIII